MSPPSPTCYCRGSPTIKPRSCASGLAGGWLHLPERRPRPAPRPLPRGGHPIQLYPAKARRLGVGAQEEKERGGFLRKRWPGGKCNQTSAQIPRAAPTLHPQAGDESNYCLSSPAAEHFRGAQGQQRLEISRVGVNGGSGGRRGRVSCRILGLPQAGHPHHALSTRGPREKALPDCFPAPPGAQLQRCRKRRGGAVVGRQALKASPWPRQGSLSNGAAASRRGRAAGRSLQDLCVRAGLAGVLGAWPGASGWGGPAPSATPPAGNPVKKESIWSSRRAVLPSRRRGFDPRLDLCSRIGWAISSVLADEKDKRNVQKGMKRVAEGRKANQKSYKRRTTTKLGELRLCFV